MLNITNSKFILVTKSQHPDLDEYIRNTEVN